MSMNEISIKTRQVFREYLVTNYVLREISDTFDAENVPCDLKYNPPVSGQRRSLVECYYHAVNWDNPNDVKKVLLVFEDVLMCAREKEESIRSLSGGETVISQSVKQSIKIMENALQRDGFSVLNGKITGSVRISMLDEVKKEATMLDANYLQEQIRRMEGAIDEDPALAIGKAKELIETCCKTILSERKVVIEGIPDIPTLTKLTLRELKLVPEGINDSTRGAEVIKRILRSLGTIGNDLAELRSLYGTGHGKHGRSGGLTSRHAKLAVGMATTFSTFLFETHKAIIK